VNFQSQAIYNYKWGIKGLYFSMVKLFIHEIAFESMQLTSPDNL